MADKMIPLKKAQNEGGAHRKRMTQRQKTDRDLLWVSIMSFVGLLAGGLFGLLTPVDSPEYPRAEGGMFVVCVLAIVGGFALMRLRRGFWHEVLRVIRREESVTDAERADAVWALSFVLALVGMLLVDMSFLRNGGLRITVVAGTAFGRAIWAIIRGR